MSVQFAPLPETDPAAKNSSPNEDCGTLSADLSQAILLRDSSYYFLDVIFRVEGLLFKVPRRNFEQESDVFHAMFQLPQGSNIAEGLTDDQPIDLQQVRDKDF